MIYDCVTYNGEEELWDIHYNCLKPYVDQFIVCEAPTTFSGEAKPLYFERIKDKYPDVIYHVIDENWIEEEKMQAWTSPNTVGPPHWTREFLQKESIKKALLTVDRIKGTSKLHDGTNLNFELHGPPKDDDIIFIGDVDEIWDKSALKLTGTYKLKLKVYTYYLNNRSSEEFWGTLKTTYGHMKGLCLNHLRMGAIRTQHHRGWHFTSQARDLHKKLTDSYTQESYATPYVLDRLQANIDSNRDFLGRDFNYWEDTKKWPAYLKNNREKYRHLCKETTEDLHTTSGTIKQPEV